MDRGRLTLRSDDPDIREHLKHLGPSNAATRPKSTRIPTVKIKPGIIPTTIPENAPKPSDGVFTDPSEDTQGHVGEGSLPSAGREASDGVHSVVVGYGTMAPERMSWKSGNSRLRPTDEDVPTSPKSGAASPTEHTKLVIDNLGDRHEEQSEEPTAAKRRSQSISTVGSLRSIRSRSTSPPKKRHTARSGSISENIVDVNGVKKIVLETTSSSDEEVKGLHQADDVQEPVQSPESHSAATQSSGGKKKRKKRGKKKKNAGGNGSESQPLLSGEHS